MSWVNDVIENFGETTHTKRLIKFAEETLMKSITFVDFFANIVMEIFKDYGLLIVDSGDRNFRLLQKEYFSHQIEHHNEITNYLLEQQRIIGNSGFPITIDSNEKAANLFFYNPKSSERILLEFDSESNQFVGKSGAVSFSKEELIEIAFNNPEKLSNNVVTRPLMQEWLFPTLAFIAGPGEISYWAELKLVFEHFKLKMPPIVPRLNITLLERAIERDMKELNLDLSAVLSRGSMVEREQYLESIKDKEISALFSSLKSQLIKQYELIEAKTSQLDKGLLPLVKKNESYLLKEIGFMESKLEDSVKSKYDVFLSKFNRVDLSLRPDGFPQERVWNIFYFLNQYGTNFITQLMQLEFEFDGRHKVVKL